MWFEDETGYVDGAFDEMDEMFYLRTIWVRPELRCLGHGSRLLSHVPRRAKLIVMSNDPDVSDEILFKFYAKHGFHVVEGSYMERWA